MLSMPNERCASNVLAAHSDLEPHEVAALIGCAGKHPLDPRFQQLAHTHIDHTMAKTRDIRKFVGAVTTFHKTYGSAASLGILYENVLARPGAQLSASFLRQYLVALAHHNVYSAIKFMKVAVEDNMVAVAFDCAAARGTETQIAGWHDLSGKQKAAVVMAGIVIGQCHVLSAWAQRAHDQPHAISDRQKAQFAGAFKASVDVLEFASAWKLPLSGETIGRCIMLLAVPMRSSYYPNSLCPRKAAAMLNRLTQHHIIISPAVGNWIGNAWIRVVGRIGNGVDQVWNIVQTMARMGFIHEMGNAARHTPLSGRPATSKAAKIATRHIVQRAYANERRDTRNRYSTACSGAISSFLDRSPINAKFRPCKAQDFVDAVNQQSHLADSGFGALM